MKLISYCYDKLKYLIVHLISWLGDESAGCMTGYIKGKIKLRFLQVLFSGMSM